jgi:general secretion pathway protein A
LKRSSHSVIDEAAINAIEGYCQGCARLINSIMTKSMMLGAQLKKQSIDAELILSASNEFRFSNSVEHWLF